MEIETDGVNEAVDGANAADYAAGSKSDAPHSSARGKLLAWLAAHPAGADARELIGLLFKGAGRDPNSPRD
jgi:hypothetical protein